MPKIMRNEIRGIKCDAPGCEYSDMSVSRADYMNYLDAPCPVCGAPLLTVADLLSVMRLEQATAWINRWFGWLAWFGTGRELMVPVHMNGTGEARHHWAAAVEREKAA